MIVQFVVVLIEQMTGFVRCSFEESLRIFDTLSGSNGAILDAIVHITVRHKSDYNAKAVLENYDSKTFSFFDYQIFLVFSHIRPVTERINKRP